MTSVLGITPAHPVRSPDAHDGAGGGAASMAAPASSAPPSVRPEPESTSVAAPTPPSDDADASAGPLGTPAPTEALDEHPTAIETSADAATE